MLRSTDSGPEVSVVTSHGRQVLNSHPGERLIDTLNRHGVPWSALSIYTVVDGGDPEITPCLDRVVSDYNEVDKILLYFNRNVNPFKFAVNDFTAVESDGEGAATEYLYQDLVNETADVTTYLKKLNPEECREVIADRVNDTISRVIGQEAETLVVGISGGGDSNAMLHGLTLLDNSNVTIKPVILMGIPDWDSGVPRAKELCENYGLDLTVITEPEVRQLLGIEAGASLIDRFEREFQGDDFEFMGTLLIRLALTEYAKRLGASYIATGLNLEDVLCEAMYRTTSGLPAAGLPARRIGEVTLLYPLWLCPKRIIDGCFPKYSLANYDMRYPCFSLGRNLYYSMIYTLQSAYPGMCERLAEGFAKMSDTAGVEYHLHRELGFYVERDVPFPLVRRFKKMLSGSSLFEE